MHKSNWGHFFFSNNAFPSHSGQASSLRILSLATLCIPLILHGIPQGFLKLFPSHICSSPAPSLTHYSIAVHHRGCAFCLKQWRLLVGHSHLLVSAGSCRNLKANLYWCFYGKNHSHTVKASLVMMILFLLKYQSFMGTWSLLSARHITASLMEAPEAGKCVCYYYSLQFGLSWPRQQIHSQAIKV